MTAPEPAASPGRPRHSSARRAGTIIYLVLSVPITLLLAVVTLLLLLGMMTDPAGYTPQIPAIVVGLVMTMAGGLSIFLKLRRLVRGD